MAAARLLAVYFATAASALIIIRRWLAPVSVRAGLFLALAPFLFVGRAMVTARVYAPLDITYVHQPFQALAQEKGTSIVRTPILSDVVFSMIPWRKAVRDAVKGGRLPLWNRFQLAGEPLLAVQQHGAFHPETLPSLLLPLAHAWTLIMALRFFVSLVSAYLFLRDVADREVPAIFGSVAWAFCDFLVFYEGYPLSPAVGPLPLLLLGLRRLAREPGRRAVTITVIALVLMVTAGHPESLLHAVSAGGVYFLFELFVADPGKRVRAVLLSFLAGAIALGLCAIVLLPLVEVLPVTVEHLMRSMYFAHQKKSVALRISEMRALRDFVPYAFGVLGGVQVVPGFHEPGAYAGSLLVPLAWLGLKSRRREKWGFLILGLVGLAVSIGLRGIADAVGRLPLFRIALNERLEFAFAFGLVALAALGIERLARGEARRELGIAALVFAAGLAVVFWRIRPGAMSLGISSADLTRRFALQLAPPLLLVPLALAARGRRAGWMAAAAVGVLLVERRLEAGDLYPSYPETAFAPRLPVLDPIPRDEPWRFAAVGYELIPNVSCLYELEDVRSYSSMTLFAVTQTFPLWSMPQPAWFNRIDDPTRPFLSFLNVRYVLLPPSATAPNGWPVLARSAGGTLVENRGALPRAFIPEKVALIADPAGRLAALGRISDFKRLAIIEQIAGGEDVPQEAPNGSARVWISSYQPQEMRMEVEAREPTVVATSVPQWPGWKLSVDGKSWPPVTVNHAFVGFRSPAGRHTARLRYFPDSVRTGLVVSLVTAAACAVMLILRRLSPENRIGEKRAA